MECVQGTRIWEKLMVETHFSQWRTHGKTFARRRRRRWRSDGGSNDISQYAKKTETCRKELRVVDRLSYKAQLAKRLRQRRKEVLTRMPRVKKMHSPNEVGHQGLTAQQLHWRQLQVRRNRYS